MVVLLLLVAALCRAADPIADFRAALERNPRSADAAYNLALALLQGNRASDALAILDTHTHAVADHYMLRGAVLNALGRTADAAQSLRRALSLDPNNADSLYDLAITLLHLERNAEATTLLDGGRARFPRVAKLHAASGMVAYAMGKNAEAVRSYETAVKLEPAADLYSSLGDIHDATGDLVRAEAAYAQALRMEPDSAEYLVKHGRCLVKLQRPKDAEAALARAVQREPRNADAHFQLGKLATARGDHLSAIPHYERAVAANPSLKEAWYQLGVGYRRAGRDAESRLAVERFRKLE